MLNIKATHRATTAMREAFENGLRHWVTRTRLQKVTPNVEMVADALAHNAGVMRVPDVSVNVSTKTWNQLKQLKAV